MNFSEKTLVVSGCSHTAGGGMDVVKYWDKIFSEEEVSHFKDFYVNDDGIVTIDFFNNVLFKKVWPYFLHKKLKTKEYYNLAKGGGGWWSALQKLYRFIHERVDDPKNTIIIYQITEVGRIELVNTFPTGEQWFGSQMMLQGMEGADNLFEMFYKHFYDDGFFYYKLIMDLFNFQKYCESLGIEVYFLDWNAQIQNEEIGVKLTKQHKDGRSPIMDFVGFYTQMHGIEKPDLQKYTSELNVICCRDFWESFTDETEIKISNGKEVIDHHLNPIGSKSMSNYIFEKKFKKSLDN